MKKFLINITFILMMLIIPININALSTETAKESIVVDKESSMILNYSYNDYNFDNVNVKIYYIASVTSEFQYQLSSDFLSYPIEVNGIKTIEEWNSLEQTLDAYIDADNISEHASLYINNNKLEIKNLKTGLYFVKTEKVDTDKYTLLFDSFLISIPDLNEDGTWNYDVNIYPKAEEYTPKYEKINYTVVKQWIDNKDTRPESIDIEIYEDGKLVDNQTLSSENNWSYSWITDDDGSTWNVVERNVPEGYNVSINNKDKTFIVINKDPNYQEENPKTLDNINLYLYLFGGSLIGIILLIITFISEKKHS